MTASEQTKTRANAVITVHKYEPAAYDEPTEGPALSRIHVEESFSGDISDDGVVELLQAARLDGSASCDHPAIGANGESLHVADLQPVATLTGDDIEDQFSAMAMMARVHRPRPAR